MKEYVICFNFETEPYFYVDIDFTKPDSLIITKHIESCCKFTNANDCLNELKHILPLINKDVFKNIVVFEVDEKELKKNDLLLN